MKPDTLRSFLGDALRGMIIFGGLLALIAFGLWLNVLFIQWAAG